MSLNREHLVDQLCVRFEQAWQEKPEPDLQPYLDEVEESERIALFRELLHSDKELRERHSLDCSEARYLELYPDYASVIRSVVGIGGEQTKAYSDSHFDGVSPSSVDSREYPELPGYEILRLLGEGGMGQVFEARQTGTEQVVALKVIRRAWLEGLDSASRTRLVEQFRAEVKAAGRLRDPNRVRIFHYGEHEGQPYYSMELIEGCTLADKIEEGMPKEAAVAYLSSVASAVSEIHDHGILHRDIKPHNILIDTKQDKAFLADFGLATLDKPNLPSDRSESGRVGTPLYMSPEQTEDGGQPTKASDIYSLGATLYEALTGRPPFEQSSVPELFERIRNEEPAPLRRHDKSISRRLEAISSKCLEKDPQQRYTSAQSLTDSLNDYLLTVRYSKHFTTMGIGCLILAPIVLLINVSVFALLRTDWPGTPLEIVIWLVMFSMYPALFMVFLSAPSKETGRDFSLSRLEMWTAWGGKMFGAIAISIAIRVTFHSDPRTAITLVYPVFASLSGMAVFVMVCKMPRILYSLAFGSWATSILMVVHLPWSPIYYGVYSCVGVGLFGVFLRRLGRELS